MQAGDHRGADLAGELLGLGAQDVGGRQVDDVGGEVGDVAPDLAGEAERQAILRAARKDDRRDRHQAFERLGIDLGRRRRIDTDLGAFDEAQMVDEPAERLGRAIAGIVEIAREQGDAKGRLGGRLVGRFGHGILWISSRPSLYRSRVRFMKGCAVRAKLAAPRLQGRNSSRKSSPSVSSSGSEGRAGSPLRTGRRDRRRRLPGGVAALKPRRGQFRSNGAALHKSDAAAVQ